MVPLGDLKVWLGGRTELPADLDVAILNCIDAEVTREGEWCYNPNYYGSVGGSMAQRDQMKTANLHQRGHVDSRLGSLGYLQGPIEDDGSLTLISMASDHQTIHRVSLGVRSEALALLGSVVSPMGGRKAQGEEAWQSCWRFVQWLMRMGLMSGGEIPGIVESRSQADAQALATRIGVDVSDLTLEPGLYVGSETRDVGEVESLLVGFENADGHTKYQTLLNALVAYYIYEVGSNVDGVMTEHRSRQIEENVEDRLDQKYLEVSRMQRCPWYPAQNEGRAKDSHGRLSPCTGSVCDVGCDAHTMHRAREISRSRRQGSEHRAIPG
eukprot:Skav213043  [mRNA]  locus=scaffold844:756409:761058:+ [translate_table: standard]